jgi:hypothetical protein
MVQMKWMLAASAAALSLLGASVAQGATVTVGSPLTAIFGGTLGSSPSGTWFNDTLAEPGATVASPYSGTVVRWRLTGNYGPGPFELRVLHPTGGGAYTGAGTSSPAYPAGGLQVFPTSLPIKSGDFIGVDIGNSYLGVSGVTGSHVENWNPPLADGMNSVPPYPFHDVELGYNADVDYTTAAPHHKKCKKKHHHRSALSAKKRCKKKRG